MPLKDKIRRSDYIVYNNGSLKDLYLEIDKWADKIL